jgi:hypothetical protein
MKALVVLLAASGLLLASQLRLRSAGAFRFRSRFSFTTSTKGISSLSRITAARVSITVRATAAPEIALPRGMHTFIARITLRAITTDHNPAIITGRNRTTTGQGGADTEVGKGNSDRRGRSGFVVSRVEGHRCRAMGDKSVLS